jgi:hypothetical protein
MVDYFPPTSQKYVFFVVFGQIFWLISGAIQLCNAVNNPSTTTTTTATTATTNTETKHIATTTASKAATSSKNERVSSPQTSAPVQITAIS